MSFSWTPAGLTFSLLFSFSFSLLIFLFLSFWAHLHSTSTLIISSSTSKDTHFLVSDFQSLDSYNNSINPIEAGKKSASMGKKTTGRSVNFTSRDFLSLDSSNDSRNQFETGEKSASKKIKIIGDIGNFTSLDFISLDSTGRRTSGDHKFSCDLFNGTWVFDDSYPLYTNHSCFFIDDGFNCEANGRPDRDYMKWRWKPNGCDIPRFDALKMLSAMRGKRLVFVGDSINRNQWESLLCLLSSGVDPNRVYEAHGRKITKERGNYAFRFLDYKCSVEYYVTHFLVKESRARVGRKRKSTLRLDLVDRISSRWRGADFLVFNSNHWWTHQKTMAGVNYFQEGETVYPFLDVLTAFRKAMMTWASWVDQNVDRGKTQVFFRTSSPSHFRGGEWNSGGHCGELTQPISGAPPLPGSASARMSSILEEVVGNMNIPVTLLDITRSSGLRIDGHPSIYGHRRRGGAVVQDCSHWCLPGVPDHWNELLFFHVMRSHF